MLTSGYRRVAFLSALILCLGLTALVFSAPVSSAELTAPQLEAAATLTPTRTPIPTWTPPPAAFQGVLINLGGPVYTDTAGSVWWPDQASVGDYTGYYGGSGTWTDTSGADIQGTGDDTLFRTQRWWPSSGGTVVGGYRICCLPNGEYDVALRFAETYAQLPGQRVFDVRINGQTVISHLDLIAQYGRYVAREFLFQEMVTSWNMDISFAGAGSQHGPMIEAIRVSPHQLPTATPTATTTATGTATPTVMQTSTATATTSGTATVTATPTRLPVLPILQCVNEAYGSIYSYWGYDNPNPFTVTIPFGPQNRFIDDWGDNDLGPHDFAPGQHFDFDIGEPPAVPLTWVLDGSSITASASSPRCGTPTATVTPTVTQTALGTATATPLPVLPILDCVTEVRQDWVGSQWYYNNPNPFTITIPFGARNKILIGDIPGDLRSGLDTFAPGQHYAFNTSWSGTAPLTWVLDGSAVSASKASPHCPTLTPTPTRTTTPTPAATLTPTPTPLRLVTTVDLPAIADTMTSLGNPAANYRSATELYAGYHRQLQSWFKFDLSALPLGSQIASAQLMLWHLADGDVALSVSRPLSDWTEAGLTWNNQPDYDYVTYLDTWVANEPPRYVTWDVTGLTQQWLSGDLPNTGVMLTDPNGNYAARFASRENRVANHPPLLRVTYSYVPTATPTPLTPMPTAPATLTPTITATASPTRLPVVPLLHCVNTLDRYIAASFWGYDNPNPFAVTIPFGAQNYFSIGYYSGAWDLAPHTFAPGRHFTIELGWTSAWSMTWYLDGSDLTATSDSPPCTTPTPTATPLSAVVGLSAIADTMTSQGSPATNYATATELYAGYHRQLESWFKFDLSAIPAGAQVMGAQLMLWHLVSGSVSFDVFRPLADWTEAGLTWNNQPGYDPLAVGNTWVPGETPGYMSWNVTSLVQHWLAGDLPNTGIMVTDHNDSNSARFVSKEDRAANHPPLLRVIYASDLGATPTVTATPAAPAGSPTATPLVVRYEQRVNAGAWWDYVDSQGTLWAADGAFWPGSSGWGHVGSSMASTTSPIANTEDDPLYQTEEYWTTSASPGYLFTVPNGSYDVTLKFAEIYHSAAGLRRFNVKVEGRQVLTNYDPFVAAGGENRAAPDVTVTVNVTDGELDIDFIRLPGFDAPKVSAIAVVQR